MAYVQRDDSGTVIAIYANLQPGYAEESLPEGDPEIQEFFNPPISAPTVEVYQAAIQNMVDEVARSKLFNDGVTMASYVSSTVQPWAAQAQTFVAWRDAIWQYSYAELDKVQSGARPQPSVADFLAELPEISWPAE
jgi:predicted metalloendopeptidase